MSGLIRILLIIFLIYLVLRFLGRLLAPMMMKKMVRDAQKRFEEQFQNPYYGKEKNTEPGKTYISKKRRPDGKIEDADFEEIE